MGLQTRCAKIYYNLHWEEKAREFQLIIDYWDLDSSLSS